MVTKDRFFSFITKLLCNSVPGSCFTWYFSIRLCRQKILKCPSKAFAKLAYAEITLH